MASEEFPEPVEPPPEPSVAKATEVMGRHFDWTERRLHILRRLYPTFTSGDIADVIGCSDVAVRNKAHELGLKKDRSFRPIDYYGRYTGKKRLIKPKEP